MGLAACATSAGVDSTDAQPGAQHSTAVLFVERQAADSAGTSAHVGARFVQYTGIATEALPDLLGVAVA